MPRLGVQMEAEAPVNLGPMEDHHWWFEKPVASDMWRSQDTESRVKLVLCGLQLTSNVIVCAPKCLELDTRQFC